MTVGSLLDMADLFGLNEEDVFNPNFLGLDIGANSLSSKGKSFLIAQVGDQVNLLRGEQKANEFDDDDIEEYIP